MDLTDCRNNIRVLRGIAIRLSGEDGNELRTIADGCDLTITALAGVVGSLRRVSEMLKDEKVINDPERIRHLSNKLAEIANGYNDSNEVGPIDWTSVL